MIKEAKFCKICKSRLQLKYKNLFDIRHGCAGKFQIYECSNCGFMQTRPELKRNEISKIYSKYYPRQKIDLKFISEAGKNMPSKKELWLKGLWGTCHYDTKKGEKVLDIGSGVGSSLAEIEALGGKAWGIDPDLNALKIARKLKLNFHHGFLDNCPFKKSYFDLITASQVIEHEPLPLKFLKLCKKNLKGSGRIRLSFPNTGALYKKLWGRNWLHWHIPYHLNHFNRKSFRLLAKKAGLEVVSMKTVTPNLWTILQIRSWINNPKEGERDYMWDGGQQLKKSKEVSRKFLSQALPYVEKLLLINRLIDILGLGESLVVELRPQ